MASYTEEETCRPEVSVPSAISAPWALCSVWAWLPENQCLLLCQAGMGGEPCWDAGSRTGRTSPLGGCPHQGETEGFKWAVNVHKMNVCSFR